MSHKKQANNMPLFSSFKKKRPLLKTTRERARKLKMEETEIAPGAVAMLIPYELILYSSSLRTATDQLVAEHMNHDRIRFCLEGMVITAELVSVNADLQMALMPFYDERSSSRPVLLTASNCRALLSRRSRRKRPLPRRESMPVFALPTETLPTAMPIPNFVPDEAKSVSSTAGPRTPPLRLTLPEAKTEQPSII
jgi:hypothetical protein